jgi:MoxR-like ATPase
MSATEDVTKFQARFTLLKAEVGKVLVGQDDMLHRLLLGLLAGGHVLLEGVPGLAKTLVIRTLAEAIDGKFSRIQFTPDMLPGDVIGTQIFNPREGNYTIKKGPVFGNFILADEINRAPAKVQSALLEAMQEKQVTLGDQTLPLAEPFLVLATQNPIEQEGTYPLPEAQLDRFMFNIPVIYPTPDEEVAIVKATTANASAEARPVLKVEEILRLQELVRGVPVADSVVRYAVNLVGASRPAPGKGPIREQVQKFLTYGGSPRASQYLILGAKARAVLSGKFHVDFADVRAVAHPVLRHRLVLNFQARAEGIGADDLIKRLFELVREP